jgi:hypothetical protein
MAAEDERENFETWAMGEDFWLAERFLRGADGEYMDDEVHAHFVTWKAARAVLARRAEPSVAADERVPDGRRVTYVPMRRKKGVMQVTAWGPVDMVLEPHRRIIEDTLLYAPQARAALAPAAVSKMDEDDELREVHLLHSQEQDILLMANYHATDEADGNYGFESGGLLSLIRRAIAQYGHLARQSQQAERDEAASVALHNAIMNLPCKRTMSHFAGRDEMLAYKEGHRDARHAAAELALATASQEGAHAAQWISVADSLPEKYCLAVYETPSGKQRIIRAMYVAKFTVKAQGDDCYSEINDENDTEYLREGWYELVDNWGEYSSVNVCEGVVTYWRPLPPLPSLRTPACAERSGEE